MTRSASVPAKLGPRLKKRGRGSSRTALGTDNLTPEHRRRTMQAVRSTDTTPELKVRRMVHGMGYRYRLHRRDLPGTPDLVFPARRKAIFVHGCFWHGHTCAAGRNRPRTNSEYWEAKIERNRSRDRRARRRLAAIGWKSLVVWECRMKNEPSLKDRIRKFLEE